MQPFRAEAGSPETAGVAADDLPRDPAREQAWVWGIRAGDEASFKALFDAYYDRLHAFAERYVRSPEVAEDLAVDVFVRIWERRAEWEVRGSLRAYLYVAARNHALTYLEHQRVVKRAHSGLNGDELPLGMGRPPVAADAEAEAHELAEALDHALEQLSGRSREAFVLHRKHGLTYAEVAKVMGIAPRTVEVHIRRAFQALRGQLAGFLALLATLLQ